MIVLQVGACLIAAQKSDGAENTYLWAYYWVIALLIVGVGLMFMMKAPKAPAQKAVEEAAPAAS